MANQPAATPAKQMTATTPPQTKPQPADPAAFQHMTSEQMYRALTGGGKCLPG
jgi:hypothetical protein